MWLNDVLGGDKIWLVLESEGDILLSSVSEISSNSDFWPSISLCTAWASEKAFGSASMAAFAKACSPYAGTVDADELECTGALDIVLATVFVSLDSRDFLVDKFNKTESILGNWPRDCVAEADGMFADVELEEDAGVDWLLSVLGNRDRSCKKDKSDLFYHKQWMQCLYQIWITDITSVW